MEPLQDFEQTAQEVQDADGISLKEILTGSVITGKLIPKHIKFILWLTFLGIVYIGNRYHAERVARNANALQKEVNELRAESITTAARLMNLNRQSKVTELVKARGLGLSEAVTPPYKIEK